MQPKIQKVEESSQPQIRSQRRAVSQDVPSMEVPLETKPTRSVHNPMSNPSEGLNTELLRYPIKYELLSEGKLMDVPAVLHYKPIDGFCVTLLNELNMETIDEGINSLLDSLCYETKYEGFSHWDLPTPEKVRAFLNLRINSEGQVVDILAGICSKCGNVQQILKVDLLSFDDMEIKPEYREPFPLKAKVKDEELKFTARLLRSGDVQRAKNIIKKDKNFLSQMFPNVDVTKMENVVEQILEYANSIVTIKGASLPYEEKVIFCRDNIQIMNALTHVNDYFAFGMKMEHSHPCENKECPSNVEEQKIPEPRRSLFQVPIQAALFTYQSEQKESTEFFDLD